MTLCRHIERAIELDDTLRKMEILVTQTPMEDRANALTECIERRLYAISAQLMSMQLAGVMELARKHDSDRELEALIADWKFRSPITRSDE